jgi:hypothetical protein
MNTQEQIDALRARIERLELNHSEKPNSCEPDYTHLLPTGYEFCTEEEVEKWVKVQLNPDIPELKKVGYIWNNPTIPSSKRYRPIRPIQYHVAAHESVTAEPDPYQVDWEKAPDGTVAHHYQMDDYGWFDRLIIFQGEWVTISEQSGYTLQSGLDWKKSLRLNPKLK